MKRAFILGYLIIVVVLAFALMSYNGSASAADPLLGITDTPTPPTPDTPTPDTPTPDTPTPDTPTPDTPTPPPVRTVTPTMGTPHLPETGEVAQTPMWLLIVMAGGLLALGIWLLRQAAHLFEPSRGE